MRMLPLLIAGAMLPACGDPGTGAGGVTPDEARQLDEAGAMLDEQANESALPAEEWLPPDPAQAGPERAAEEPSADAAAAE